MNLPRYTGPRFKLGLGKYRVLRVIKKPFGEQQFSLDFHGQLLSVPAPHDADVREGDLLELYMEVPLAIPSSTPKQ